jgi:hypothetical protein
MTTVVEAVDVETEGLLVFSLFVGKDKNVYIKFGEPFDLYGTFLDGLILHSASEVSGFLHDIGDSLSKQIKQTQ